MTPTPKVKWERTDSIGYHLKRSNTILAHIWEVRGKWFASIIQAGVDSTINGPFPSDDEAQTFCYDSLAIPNPKGGRR